MTVDLDALEKSVTLVNNQAGRKVGLLAAVAEPPQMELTIDGASTLTVKVADHERQLVTDPTIDLRSWAVVDGLHFELAGVSKSGDYLTLTFEDAIVAALRRRNKAHSFKAGAYTRAQIGAWFCTEAGVPHAIDPTHTEKVHNPITRSADGQTQNSWEVLGSDVAQPINWRCFSDGTQIVLGGDAWLMSGYKKPVTIRERTDGIQSIDFDLDAGKRASKATVTVDTRLRSFLPGTPVTVEDLGPADGLWIASRFSRAVTTTTGTLELVRKTHVLKEPKAQKTGRGRGHGEPGSPDYIPGSGGTDAGGTAANPARERMVRFALAQQGKPYAWGASGPGSFDCSGLVQAATAHAGKPLGKPSASQWATCQRAGKAIPVSEALKIRGALLFRINVGDFNHVAVSLGNGSTMEAEGSAYGCRIVGGAAGRGWTGGALWL